ncbi:MULTISPECIES: fasciclin domain-containing protein [Actinomadura]|uniref:Fasciclin domain-containing protein n=1 Tax=Actinomadura litoris TaxID=2678616 RepID=A0A7K1L1S1_9ACTN|nr:MULTISPECIES: fasciclin domain-containing protein [Actinomadura]MBT2206547.1 fasciclin domain-containing protein [Actinomadura sp. NEAU-AAG7]MUN38352.1 fasciclin domain-containing protein [Actinomadura litoris]
MYRIPHTRVAACVLAAAAVVTTAAACSDDDKDGGTAAAPATPAAPTSAAPSAAPSADQPFGPACSAVPTSGKGSFSGMSADPVATAASNNPVLSTLVGAVKQAGLVDTLNSAKNITVFAPTDEAFKKIPKATLDKVMNDKKALTAILTYHVVGQPITPSALANADEKTLNGATLKTSGSGESFTVGGTARVVCGNVHTANATVYIIDTVLMPPK